MTLPGSSPPPPILRPRSSPESAAAWVGSVCSEPDAHIEFSRPTAYAELLERSYGKLRQLHINDPRAGFDEAARVARTEGVSRAQQQALLREKVVPLPRRPRADKGRVD